MSDVKWQSFDWTQLVRAADPKPTYHDIYRFSGRTFRKRDEHSYVPHDAVSPQPIYRTLDENE